MDRCWDVLSPSAFIETFNSVSLVFLIVLSKLFICAHSFRFCISFHTFTCGISTGDSDCDRSVLNVCSSLGLFIVVLWPDDVLLFITFNKVYEIPNLVFLFVVPLKN